MEVIHPRCAGIDVSKKDAKVCVRVQGRGRKATSSEVTTWTSMTSSILALREYLIAERVTCVVIESTAAYWKPFYFLLDDALNVMLVNARHVRNVPGRKTDVSDAAWLAELGAHGLVRASFVPPEPIRVLRDLTGPHHHRRGPYQRDWAAGDAARRRRDQTVVGGLRDHRGFGAGDARSAHRWPTRPRRAGRSG
jgi:hypothetical protein